MKRSRRYLLLLSLFCVLSPRASARTWYHSIASDDTAYFLVDTPPAIERFDLFSGNWQSPIPLVEPPITFAVDSSGIYVAFHQGISRFDLEGTFETRLTSNGFGAGQLLIAGNQLIIVYGGEMFGAHVISLDKLT